MSTFYDECMHEYLATSLRNTIITLEELKPIKTIVTKEQFESISYKVERKD